MLHCVNDDDDEWLEVERHSRPGVERVALDRKHPLVVGRTAPSDVTLPGDGSVTKRHVTIALEGGAWRVNDLHSTNGTFVNAMAAPPGRPLLDGDVVGVGRARLRFRAASVRLGGRRSGDWALFGPARDRPTTMLHALAAGGERLHTSVSERATPTTLAGPLEVRARIGQQVVVDDVTGPNVAELRALTAGQGSAVDPAFAVAVARTVVASEVTNADTSIFVTFAGALVAISEPGRLSLPERLRTAARTLLTLAGGPTHFRSLEEAARLQRDELAGSHRLAAEARASLQAIADVAVDDPLRIPFALANAVRVLGEPTASQLSTMARELFPHAAAQHARLVEEAVLLGVDGITA